MVYWTLLSLVFRLLLLFMFTKPLPFKFIWT